MASKGAVSPYVWNGSSNSLSRHAEAKQLRSDHQACHVQTKIISSLIRKYRTYGFKACAGDQLQKVLLRVQA
jgi:hypothetical protein